MKFTEPKRDISGKKATKGSMENKRSADTGIRQDRIATAAYYKAEVRGFMPGLEIADWLEAEAELNESAGL